MPVLSGGIYDVFNRSSYKRNYKDKYATYDYTIVLSKASSFSDNYDRMRFQLVRDTFLLGPGQGYVLRTFLHKLEPGEPDIPLAMADGNWEIIYVDLVQNRSGTL